jgi:hypothetical protein
VSPEPSQPTCALCAAPLTDQGYICHPDTARLAADLRAIPDLLAELDTTITRQARISTPSGKGNGDKPIPFDPKASAAAGNIRAVLFGWTKVLLEETDPDDTDYAIAGRAPAFWLGQHLADIRMREWAGEVATELKRASAEGWRAIDRPEERWYAGPCGNEIDLDDGTVQCGTVLWARIEEATIRCRGCLHTWDVAERREWLVRAAEDHLESARIIASALTVMTRRRITASTIRNWASEGIVTALGERDGAKLYRVGDILAAMNRPPAARKSSDPSPAADPWTSEHAA